MSTRKLLIASSFASVLALVGMFALGSEVRAGDQEIGSSSVDESAIAQAQSFTGEYVFMGGQKEREGIDAAIEVSMAAVGPMVRSLGRKRLHETNGVPKHISIQVEGDKVRIAIDGEVHQASLGAAAIRGESAQGDKIKVTHRMRGSKLVQHIDAIGGARTNNFKLADDGSRLYLDVAITSPQLPVAVEYRLTFKRQ